MNRLILISPDRGSGFKPHSYGKGIVIIFGNHICCSRGMGCVIAIATAVRT